MIERPEDKDKELRARTQMWKAFGELAATLSELVSIVQEEFVEQRKENS
jgi:hypothetical protein